MNKILLTVLSLLVMSPRSIVAADNYSVFDRLDLTRAGMEKVAEYHRQGLDSLASIALLDYFKSRKGVKCIGVDADNPHISAEEQRWADDGLEHKFFVHKGYQPSYFYGDDINWQYWPVKDNELRWQLHRTKWWVPMGKAYRLSGDEKYAREWTAQYLDWIKKNPLTAFNGIKDKDMEDVDNVYFAWRPLEVCDRLEHQIEQFSLFLPSSSFTPDFLMTFLDNYYRHATFANSHYSAEGNHLLFEAQRVIYAGAFFPEFKDAPLWRKTGVEILNREIKKQVFDDGVQYELDPGYHMACVGIFGKALEMMDANGYLGEFPESYIDTMHHMIEFTYNIAFPDYTLPVFSDNKLHTKSGVQGNYRSWSRFFPNDEILACFATDGRSGRWPSYSSRAFTDGGFYIMRNGWLPDATMMVLKAGPEGEWHNQYDNGTFEMWSHGRNFFPDSGSYIYGGDKEVLEQRNWFRQTAVHNTLTLDNRNLDHRKSHLLKWDTTLDGDIAVIETPGYDGLTHRRAVFFVDKKFYVIADEAYGNATGDVAIHYQLLPSAPIENFADRKVSTSFNDNNNIVLKVFGAENMLREEGWMSSAYRVKEPRPAYAFTSHKSTSRPVRFITVIYPTDSSSPDSHRIKASYKDKNTGDGAKIEVSVDGKKYHLSYSL